MERTGIGEEEEEKKVRQLRYAFSSHRGQPDVRLCVCVRERDSVGGSVFEWQNIDRTHVNVCK